MNPQMNPQITEILKEDNCLKFTLEQTNVSIANGLRRIMIAEIPCLVFRTNPYEKNQVSIEVNTTRMNNELIKQRISCIPIHITDIESFPFQEHVVEVDMKNDEESIKYLTTEHFEIKNTVTDTYLSKEETRKVFPPDPITGDFIDIVRLRPGIKNATEGEHIKMKLRMSISTAKEDSSFNVVSTCAYAASQDETKIEEAWNAKKEEMTSSGIEEAQIDKVEKDWRLLDAKRITKPDSFQFVIESVGQYDETDIVKMAIKVMINKIQKLAEDIVVKQDVILTQSTSTINNSYDIKLVGEDYTLGKVIEFVLYQKYFETTLSFCGFRKPHPHIDESLIRIGFKDNIDVSGVIQLVIDVCNTALQIYQQIDEGIASNTD